MREIGEAKRFKPFFSLLLSSQRIYNSYEINDLGAVACDFNPEALSIKRYYEKEELA